MSNPVPTNPPAQSTPAPTPAAPTPAAPAVAPLSTEAQTLLNQFTLVDPTKSGVGLDKLRVFYPRVGWDVIFGMVHELEAAGRLTKRAVLNSRGSVGYHVYTWKEA